MGVLSTLLTHARGLHARRLPSAHDQATQQARQQPRYARAREAGGRQARRPVAGPTEIEEANKVDVGSLRDPQTLAERTKPGHEQWLITMGVCTHLGCIPQGASPGEVKGEFGGYFCPCHGSHYDTAARIRKGPAPLNLQVPVYEFVSDTQIKIG